MLEVLAVVEEGVDAAERVDRVSVGVGDAQRSHRSGRSRARHAHGRADALIRGCDRRVRRECEVREVEPGTHEAIDIDVIRSVNDPCNGRDAAFSETLTPEEVR